MTEDAQQRAQVLDECRELLESGRAKLKARHESGGRGIQICGGIADLFDTVLLRLYEAALVDFGETGADGLAGQMALVPQGGFGRRDVAPYSDIDLLILYRPVAKDRVRRFVDRLVRDVSDVRLAFGPNTCTVRDAISLAREEPTVCTAMIESRYLAGSVGIYTQFMRRFTKRTKRDANRIVAAIERERGEERVRYGETVFLLEPNVKRSPGGLRDIHLLRWLGFARYGTAEPDGLQMAGALTRDDFQALRRAQAFLLRVRNDLHFAAEKPNDLLDRAQQMRLAKAFGYEGSEGTQPVEEFMQDYFRSTTDVRNLARHFSISARRAPWWRRALAPAVTVRVDGDFRMGRTFITPTRSGMTRLRSDLSEILRLADLANQFDKAIAHPATETIRKSAGEISDAMTPEVARRFVSIIERPPRLGQILRYLHELRVLQLVIPEFARARSMLQFNEYHKFTVDEHCIRAVEAATEFRHDQGTLGRVYRRIRRKHVLHLALLLHDLGKGFEEDHSQVGERIAEKNARRLGFSARDREALCYLVLNHLKMSEHAFHWDTTDDRLLLAFTKDVGSPDVLDMLFVMTAADLAAVGPEVLNDWKLELLTDLYHRAMEYLAGTSPVLTTDERLRIRRKEVMDYVSDDADVGWYQRQVDALVPPYLYRRKPRQIVRDLRGLRALAPGEAFTRGRYDKTTGTVVYTVGTHESTAPGIFHRLTGALSSKGLAILSAEINTLADGLVLDHFVVDDKDFAGGPPESRIEEVQSALTDVLQQTAAERPKFRRMWQQNAVPAWTELAGTGSRVRIDNSTSDRATIINVVAADRPELLYDVTRALYELNVSVVLAKIATRLDQVVDVFYVTDESGAKIEGEPRLADIRSRLLATIETVADPSEETA